MHVEVDSYGVIGVGVVPLRNKDEEVRKFWIAVERTDALQDITEIKIEGLAGHLDLGALEPWGTAMKPCVDNAVEIL